MLEEKSDDDLVRASMTRGALTFDKDMSVLEAAKSMAELNVGSFLVVDKDNNPQGIITERDILSKVIARELDPQKVRIGDVMSTPILSIDANETVSKALLKMGTKGIKHLIVKEKGEVVGMFSLSSLLDIERRMLGMR
jgi:malate dehydrogenase (oxaloacetate-decarboxylating)